MRRAQILTPADAPPDAAPGEKGVLIRVRVPATLAAYSAADLVASGAVPDLHRRACTALLERRGGRVVACETTRTGDCLEHSLELEAGA